MGNGDELRSLLGRFPSGVAVVTLHAGGQRVGLTVGTLVGLSLEPPLVGFSVAREAALHELLREAGRCAVSLLAAGQERDGALPRLPQQLVQRRVPRD